MIVVLSRCFGEDGSSMSVVGVCGEKFSCDDVNCVCVFHIVDLFSKVKVLVNVGGTVTLSR